MNLKKRFLISSSIAIVGSVILGFLSFTPCSNSLSIPNAPVSWTICSLFSNPILNYEKLYFGLTSNSFFPFSAYVIIIFFIVFFILNLLKSKRR